MKNSPPIKNNKKNLMQFWDQKVAPLEVEELMSTWKADNGFNYQRFNNETAHTFIEDHFDSKTLKAYQSCNVPAMQADFFRYCYLFESGGIYVDADTKNSEKLNELLCEYNGSLLMMRRENVANDFMYFSYKKHPLLKFVIERAVENIQNRISNNVWRVTGPGIMTNLNQETSFQHLFEGITFLPVKMVREFVLFKHDLEYKSGPNDWRHLMNDTKISIYK